MTSEQDCIFCRIIQEKIPATLLYRDDRVVAFRDLNPQAPTHFLVVPIEHVSSINDLQAEHNDLVGHIFQVAKKLAQEQGLTESGYRVVMNCNNDGGQTVFHIHLHLLGGRKMVWPPG